VPDLQSTVASVLADRYMANAARVRELAGPLTNVPVLAEAVRFRQQLWSPRPASYRQLELLRRHADRKTGYVRDRPREFNDPNPPSKDDALRHFDDTVDMVLKTIRAQSPKTGRRNTQAPAPMRGTASP